jgi:hypothetical protein
VAASRRYAWLWQPPDAGLCLGITVDDIAAKAYVFLEERCSAEPQFYSDPDVGGTAFGFVEIHLTVHAKDQWKIPWRVRMKLLPALLVAMNLRGSQLEQIEAVRPEPHRHPNRAARWRGKAA